MKHIDRHVPDRFEIQEVLIDHEAEVQYRALDRTLQREVILKRPGPAMTTLLRDSGDEERALRESRALARIAHPGVVRLLDVIPTEDGPLMVVEPLPGSTLGQHLSERGRLPAREVRDLGSQVASALGAVHATGAVHRGLSERNIVIRPDGSACLAGFLFAKFPKPAVSLSSIIYRADETENEGGGDSGDAKPSPVLPDHPAPEQIMGQVADARSDIFGLGCVLYHALTGEPAFHDIVGSGWVPPADIRKLAPDVPKELAAVVLKCLARSPLARFQSAHDLERALLDLTLSPGPSRVVLSASAVAVLVALVFGGMLMNRDNRDGSGTRGSNPPIAPEGSQGTRRGAIGPYERHYANSHALVIGIGEAYGESGFGRLPNAERDAIAVADALEALNDGWKVTRLIGDQASRTNILNEFVALERSGRDDRLLIYYAGHGEPHSKTDDVGFLLPADAKSTALDSSRSTWIPFDDVDRIFKQTDAKHILMLMDCCYAGRLGARRGGLTEFDALFLTQRAQHIIASSQTRQQAADGRQGGHSPFAEGVLNSLQLAANGDGLPLYSSSLFSQIMEHMRAAGAPSTPVLSYGPQSEGQFILVPDNASRTRR